MAGYAFLGTWEIVGYGYINGAHSENCGLEGVRFRLDETGDVTWTISDELKSVPLFSCDTYEIDNNCVLRFGAYAGHVIEFRSEPREPRDSMILKCEGWCMLQCKRVVDEPIEQHACAPFTLLPALEEGYFSDIKIIASNNKQFNVHLSILKLHGSDISWESQPPPFTGLPESVLGTILHFLYSECLPDTMDKSTADQVISAATPYRCLCKLVNMCQLYLKNMALKHQIIGLVNDMHASVNQIIEHFSVRNPHSPSDNITSNPAMLCFIVKQSVRDTAVVVVKLLLLCDIFTKRKSELTREERNEIIRYAKSRLPVFLSQLHRFLQVLKSTFGSMSPTQRREVATYLVPEIGIILDTVSMLISEIERGLQQIVAVMSPHDAHKSKTGVSDMLGKSLRHILHIRELTKLKDTQEQISLSLELLLHKKEYFNEMAFGQKVSTVSRNLEYLIEELPIFLLHLEEFTSALEEKVVWREFKFCFKIGTSEVSGLLQQLVAHYEKLHCVMVQISELVQRDSFTQSLHSLGLLDTNLLGTHSSDCQKDIKSSSCSTPKHHQPGYKLNLVESLCIPPTPANSTLSKLSQQLLKNGVGTDMEFEVVVNLSEQDGTEATSEEETTIIPAHRVIVASRCDWFRRALLSGMREAIEKKIVVHDTNPYLFRIFLEYLYSGRLRHNSLTTEQLSELLLISDRYEVDSLKQSCEYVLQTSIDQESVLYFLSMADQFNAGILRSACLNFISQHHELMESEVYFELPIALQTEIFDYAWTQPPLRKSSTTEQLLPMCSNPTEVDTSLTDIQMGLACLNVSNKPTDSNSSSLEELPQSHDTARLDACISQLRDILGDTAPRKTLVQVILAADYDLCRAINYFYAKNNGDE